MTMTARPLLDCLEEICTRTPHIKIIDCVGGSHDPERLAATVYDFNMADGPTPNDNFFIRPDGIYRLGRNTPSYRFLPSEPTYA